MNHQRHYSALIERAKAREKPIGYSERHHIVPKCMGGGDEDHNLVVLTAEEHFVAHQLLAKMHPCELNLVLAVNMMTVSPTGERNNNRRYGWIKRALSEATSKRFKGRVWSEEQNSARAEAVKAQWADPEFRERRAQATREGLKSRRPVAPEKRAALAAKRSEISKLRWQDPEYRAAQTAKNRSRKMTPEQREAVSQRMRGTKVSDEARASMRAARLAYIHKQTNC